MKSNFIGGEWVGGPQAVPDVNPSDNSDVVGEYARADARQVQDAVAAARAARSVWADATAQERAEVLERIGQELGGRSAELGRLLAREEGKTLAEAIGEVARAAAIFRFFAGEALRIPGEKLPPVRRGVEVEITREPVGTVGIITPWNFPIAIPAWKIAPALAYGNAVVFKPAELVPASAWELAEIISRSGLPAGVFNLVMGRGSVVGSALLQGRGVDAISFTGSVATGRALARAASERLVKLQMEMGGKNPLVVLDDADLDLAVEVALQGCFHSTGQRCTASSRIIVEQGIYKRFVASLKGRTERLVVGHALRQDTQIGPVVDESQLQRNLDYVALGRTEGAQLICGGERLIRDTEGYFMSPALFVDCDPAMRLCREEIFGPVAAVIPARDYEHALEMANDTDFGLSAGICTTSLRHASHFRRHAEAGMVMVNCPTAGADFHAPFGGRKASSFGAREQGRYAAEFYTTVKTSYIAA
ncbi:MAG: aldehyde dehydrogenase family protein [Burkholderiaceae bacterium]